MLYRRLRSPSKAIGFTLLEVMMAIVVVGLLAAIAVPSYRKILDRQKISACTADLMSIALALGKYRLAHDDQLPETLDELGTPVKKDPWGFDYRYLNFNSTAHGVKGQIRKDHNLHPLNTDFDLYSVGPDGKSVAPLTAKASQDDVIWARDGNYIGVAADF